VTRDATFILGLRALFDGMMIGMVIMLGIAIVAAAIDGITNRKG
jgi:hypothetical protein